MNKKIFAAMMIIFVIAAFIPWIWLIQTYGMENIPHYDLTILIFTMLYGLIATLIFLGIVVVGFSLKEEEPPPFEYETKRKTKTVKQKPKPKPKPKTLKENGKPTEKQVTEEEAPAELQVEAPELSEMNIDDQEPQEQKDRKASEIQPPAIWQEEEFE